MICDSPATPLFRSDRLVATEPKVRANPPPLSLSPHLSLINMYLWEEHFSQKHALTLQAPSRPNEPLNPKRREQAAERLREVLRMSRVWAMGHDQDLISADVQVASTPNSKPETRHPKIEIRTKPGMGDWPRAHLVFRGVALSSLQTPNPTP